MPYLLILTFLLAPAYVIRFGFFHLPANLLMVWVFFVWIVFWFWLIAKKKFGDFFRFKEHLNPKILILTSLLFLSGLIALFVGGIDKPKLGQFIVLFLQPISLFFIAGYIFSAGGGSASGGKNTLKAKSYLLTTIYFLLAVAGLYAILQYFTLIGLPPAWWGNSVEPKRALAFFVHPNFYALWSAPLLALLIPDLFASLKAKTYNLKAALWLLGALGLLLSLSRSGWLGLAAAVGIYLIVAADKKIRRIIYGAVTVIIIVIISVPNLRWRLILPFYGEKSASSRIELWDDGVKGVEQSPILGLGLTGFAKEYASINTDPTLDTHNFPHNIFLDFWVETGLLGLISFIGIVFIFIRDGIKNRQDIFKLGVCLFLIAIIFQGLVDNPYFKNDLAMVFWIVLALS